MSKKLENCQTLRQKPYFQACFYTLHSSCSKDYKNAIKNEKGKFLSPGHHMVHPTKKESPKIDFTTNFMPLEFCNIVVFDCHVVDLLTTFPTKHIITSTFLCSCFQLHEEDVRGSMCLAQGILLNARKQALVPSTHL